MSKAYDHHPSCPKAQAWDIEYVACQCPFGWPKWQEQDIKPTITLPETTTNIDFYTTTNTMSLEARYTELLMANERLRARAEEAEAQVSRLLAMK